MPSGQSDSVRTKRQKLTNANGIANIIMASGRDPAASRGRTVGFPLNNAAFINQRQPWMI